MLDKGKTYCTLPCMMGNGISHQSDLTLPGDLLHDLGLSYSWRADEQYRSLADRRDLIFSKFIF